jgi:hypothetical protein
VTISKNGDDYGEKVLQCYRFFCQHLTVFVERPSPADGCENKQVKKKFLLFSLKSAVACI